LARSRRQTRTGGREATKGHIPGLYSLAVGMPKTAAPPGWKWTLLTDVARLESGHTPSRKRPEYWDGEIPWIGIRDATANYGRVLQDTSQHTNELGIKNSSARVLPKNTVCLSRTASVGYVVVMGRPMATSQDFVNWVCSDRLDYQFLKYVLVSERESFLRFASGTTHQTIYFPEVKAFHVCLPPVCVQRRIASILAAYDDLIENNLRRIKILEEMAQNLYREWFVNFRFPGHENVKMVDSELGKVPEGWRRVPFTDIAEVLSGGTPKTKVAEYWDGTIPFFAPKDAPNAFYVTSTEKSITDLGLQKCNSKLYPKNTVFITARGTVGKVILPAFDMAMNQSCYALRGKDGISQFFLFLTTLWQVDYLKKNTGGATFDTIVVDTFRRMKVLNPDASLIADFSSQVEPMFALILNLLSNNITLRKTRDLLLPKLISGELDVSDLDIEVPEEAA